jgi:uncharacterized Zn finger protein (UPF0148 family)
LNGAACPYCGALFAQPPKRKRRCPTCQQTVFVKSTPQDRAKRLMTEAAANEAEQRWAAYHLRQESLRTLHTFGFGERELEQRLAFGYTEPEAVKLFLRSVAENSPELHQRKMAYSSLALCADKEGQPYRELLLQAARCELLLFKQRSVGKVEILTGGPGNACSQCEGLHGQIWEIDEALKTMPIPSPTCTSTLLGSTAGFCRCTYVADLKSLGMHR